MIWATQHYRHIFRSSKGEGGFKITANICSIIFCGNAATDEKWLGQLICVFDRRFCVRSRESAVCCVIILCAMWLCYSASVPQYVGEFPTRWRQSMAAGGATRTKRQTANLHIGCPVHCREWTASTSALQRTQAHCLGGRTWTHRMQ